MRYCLFLCSLVLTGLPASPVAAAEPLRLYTWEGYFSDTLLQRWAKSHPPLQEIHFDSSDVRDATLARGDATLDLVVINEVSATRLGQDGLLTRIDPRRLPHLAELDPRWRHSCGDYAVPYVWGTLGLLYRSDRLANAPDSWQSLLQPAPALRGHIAMVEDHDDLLVAPLITLGRDQQQRSRPAQTQFRPAQGPGTGGPYLSVRGQRPAQPGLQRPHRPGAGLQWRSTPAQCHHARTALALRYAPRG
jgi:spermidine/putrescine transport system substrate-binding protein